MTLSWVGVRKEIWHTRNGVIASRRELSKDEYVRRKNVGCDLTEITLRDASSTLKNTDALDDRHAA